MSIAALGCARLRPGDEISDRSLVRKSDVQSTGDMASCCSSMVACS
jgi:hypothetical protein